MTADEERISLVVVQPTPFCNIDCKYCYLSDRANNSRMSLDVLSSAICNLVASGRLGEILRICWHAGEPLVVPSGYYRDAFELIRSLTPRTIKIEHTIQTNGILIDDEWCELFKRYRVGIGISLDGPADIHDQFRRDRRGRGTFDRVLKGIKALQRNEVSFYVLAVLTDHSLDHPARLFDFFRELGVTEVCFNVEEIEGIHAVPSYSRQNVVGRAQRFFRAYYELLKLSSFPHWVREFDYAFSAVLRAPLEKPQNALVTPFRSLNIDYRGNFSTFCPELLGVRTEKYGPLLLGNLTRDALDACVSREPFISLNRDIRSGVNLCAATCSYYALCGGGAPSNKYFENGTFESTETHHCRIFIKALIDLAIDVMEASFTTRDPLSARQRTRRTLG
jgi:uncharacterized protein